MKKQPPPLLESYRKPDRHEIIIALKDDDLYGNTVYRIDKSENTQGADWVATSLWSLLPWINRSTEIKGRIERLSREGESVKSRQVAALVLKALGGDDEPLLKNPSFEDGMRGWVTSLSGYR